MTDSLLRRRGNDDPDLLQMVNGAVYVAIALVGWHRLRSAQDYRRMQAIMREVEAATGGVADATAGVRSTIERMSEETTRTQKLALRWAIIMTLVGAIVGGFAGALAAQILD